jgi:hypothetical protein
MDVRSLRDRIAHLTVVGRPCSAAELTETCRLVDLTVKCLRRKAEQLLRDNATGACMIAYASDGWSGKIQEMKRECAGNHVVVRRGKRYSEFLLERAFVRTLRPDGSEGVQVVLDRPRGLSQGRTSWNMFSAAVDFMPDLRSCGCTGVAIQFYCMDKLHHGAFSRAMQGRHALQYQEGFARDEFEEPTEVLESLGWTVSMSCKAHSCSNAVVWSLKHLSNDGLTKDAHVSIASLRNTADALHAKAELFVQNCVEFVDKGHHRGDVITFWEFLGVSPGWIQLFAAADPVWNGRRLLVSKEMGQSSESLAKVKVLVLYCLRWCNWSETRWLGVRKSSKLYLRSLIVGVEAIVQLVLGDRHESHYFLHGHSKSTEVVRHYFAVASISAWPAEAVQIQLLIDDRFLRFGAEMRSELPKTMAKICALPDLLWERLAFVVGPDCLAADLQDDCTFAASVCCGYMESDCFSTLDTLPFSLTQGSIEDNVHKISQVPRQDLNDAISLKIKTALGLGVDPARLVAGLRLMLDAPCSVTTVEQSHASGAVLLRDHGQYGEASLVARATLHAARHLFMPTVVEKALAKLDEDLQALDRRRPASISGRNMFFKQHGAARVAAGFAVGEDVYRAMQEPMKAHVQAWDDLSRQDRRHFEGLAQRRRALVIEQIAAKRSEIEEDKLALAASSRDKFKQRGIPNHFVSCRLSFADLEALVDHLKAHCVLKVPCDTPGQ